MAQQPTLGWAAIEWIHRWVPHGPGDVQGEPFDLDDEECRLLLRMYALDGSGRRLFDEELYSRAKGRRKTDLAGAVICFEALGPCRFERWGRGRAPVGRRVTFPFVRVLATEEGQATETAYNTARFQFEHIAARHSGEYSGLDIGLTRTFLPGGGEVRPSGASAVSKDGGKESFVLAEETHLYTARVLQDMYATVKRNLTKRPLAEPHLLQVSTMYGPGQGSVAESTHLAGEAGTGRLLVDHRQGPMPANVDDDDELRRALRACYGDAATWVGIDRIIVNQFRDPRVEFADAVRYYLNRPERGQGTWLGPGEWDARAEPSVVVGDGEPITLGFDGARTRDSTALLACHVRLGHCWPVAVWEQPPDAVDGEWEVPAGEVDTAVANTMDRYRVVRFYADPPWWETQVDTWAGQWPDRVYRFPTNRYHRMVWAVRAVENAIRAGELTHDGSSVLARHVANARRRPTTIRDPETGGTMHVLAKEHRSSRLKMDGAVALVLAWEARRDAIAAGALTAQNNDYEAAGF